MHLVIRVMQGNRQGPFREILKELSAIIRGDECTECIRFISQKFRKSNMAINLEAPISELKPESPYSCTSNTFGHLAQVDGSPIDFKCHQERTSFRKGRNNLGKIGD